MAVIQYNQFTKQQERIHKGLKEIGLSIANFYSDAVRLAHPSCTLESKANLIAHMAREIDGGLRFVFAPKEIKDEKIKIVGEERGNFASVLAAVGKNDPEDAVAKEWYKISKQLHKYAHRQEAHRPSRDVTPVLDLWKRYEQILSIFIGSYYALLQRLDNFREMKDPPKESLPALMNILLNEKQASYFFARLDQSGWLQTLKDEGYFTIENAPARSEEKNEISEWYALRFLVNLSALKSDSLDAEIKAIINPIQVAYIEGKIELHPYSIASLSRALIQLDSIGFGKTEYNFFSVVSSKNTDATLFYSLTMAEELPKKFLYKKDKISLVEFLKYAFGFSTYEIPGISIFDTTTYTTVSVKPNLDNFQIKAMFDKNGNEMMEFVGEELINTVAFSINQLDAIENREFGAFHLASIEDSDQTQFAMDWDYTLVRTIRDYANKLQVSILSSFIDAWLYSGVQILQRLAIHLIRLNFEILENKWWAFIESDNKGLFIHEPYLLIKDSSPNYNEDQLKKILSWIERTNKVEPWEGQSEENARLNRDYKVRKWLTSLNSIDLKCREIIDQFNKKYNEKNDWEITHPEYDGYSSFRIGPDMPIHVSDFEKMDLKEQVKFINDFIAPAHEPTAYQGLAIALQQNTAKTPEKYLFNLDVFLPIHTIYLQGLIKGFAIALDKDEINSFFPIIEFIKTKILQPDFVKEADKQYKDKEGMLFNIEEFISILVKKNDPDITIEQADEIVEIIITILETPSFQDNSDKIQGGYINHSLNSLQGRLLGVLLEVCMLYARKFKEKNDPSKWPIVVKEYFTKHLGSTGNTIKDFSIVLGSRLLIFLYLDKDWVNQNFDAIFNQQDDQQYEYRFATVINSIYRLDQNIYKLLNDHNFFELALDRYAESNGTLLQVMGYGIMEWQFWGVSPEENKGIIHRIIQRANKEHFKELIDAIFRNKSLPFPHIKTLWQKMLAAADGKPGFEAVYPKLLWFAELSNDFDEDTVKLSQETIEKIESGTSDVYSFTRHIYKVTDNRLESASDIVYRLFEKGITQPHFDLELQTFVRRLFIRGLTKRANEICTLVSDTGSLALQAIYNEYNN